MNNVNKMVLEAGSKVFISDLFLVLMLYQVVILRTAMTQMFSQTNSSLEH